MTTVALRDLTLQRASIVIVYDAIDRGRISRDRLREMIPEGDAQFIDMPGGPLIIAVEPIQDTNCIFDARRIYLNEGGQVEPGSGHLARMATVASSAVQGGTMVAYGLNFAVRASVEGTDSVGHLLRDKLLKSLGELEATVGGAVSWFAPKIKYVVGDVEFQLGMDPSEDEPTLLRAHLNVHHAVQSLPTQDELSRELGEQFQYMRDLLGRMLVE